MTLKLQSFFPYQLAVLADTVSRAMAQVYAERFELSRDEWRVVAALYENGAMKTADVIAHTTLDKMQVSRAVTRLEQDGLIQRSEDPGDRRNRVIELLPPGTALVRKVVPLVEARVAFLLDALDPAERSSLDAVIAKVGERAQQLIRQG
ncbi:MarR family winged helix-turn-helix transcriptional regulator [Sphaerotilus microaerophilus]|jgi:DNA-binding MarR family transcriptional regulator|uniref:Transcriptional regulator n=1 Tax=Sphaerotilus microaerophilus TaxID=2914710 RepID=A0ABM7YLV1_9BURK|nr:MarR family transcriptional regulator [Sphaerotilus sp. FB-5]BDI05367.1 transcriptional regulator [Sphaerotilus sp. FB-5]